jgi:DUF2934 family protein
MSAYDHLDAPLHDRRLLSFSTVPPVKNQKSHTGTRGPNTHELICRRAHAHYVQMGYRDGRALDDWLRAEREILGSR